LNIEAIPPVSTMKRSNIWISEITEDKKKDMQELEEVG
jgi:hypothetical protein